MKYLMVILIVLEFGYLVTTTKNLRWVKDEKL